MCGVHVCDTKCVCVRDNGKPKLWYTRRSNDTILSIELGPARIPPSLDILFKIHYMHDFTAASAPLERALGNRTVHHVIDLAPGGKVICIPPCILP